MEDRDASLCQLRVLRQHPSKKFRPDTIVIVLRLPTGNTVSVTSKL